MASHTSPGKALRRTHVIKTSHTRKTNQDTSMVSVARVHLRFRMYSDVNGLTCDLNVRTICPDLRGLFTIPPEGEDIFTNWKISWYLNQIDHIEIELSCPICCLLKIARLSR